MTNTQTIHTNINSISSEQWDKLLDFGSANFFQTKKAFQFFKSVGLEPFIFAIEQEKQITLLITGIIQKEKGIKAAFTSRAIIYGGPILSKKANEQDILELLKIMISHLKNKGIYIEIRNLNNYSNYKNIFEKAGFEYLPHLNFHLDCKDEQTMRKRMSSSKLRQIKKSIKTGAEIIEAQSIEEIKAYYAILHDLYTTKVKTPLPDLDFFIKMWKDDIAKFLLVHYKEEIIGGIVCPIFQNKTIYEWFVCGKDGQYKDVYPSILATWAAMEYAHTNKIEYFDFMGAGKPNEDYGVREFKSKFGGDLVEHGRFIYISQPLLYKVGKTAVKILKKT
ncbi:lipid II:glycine glycyltransferase FemX [Aquimarina muelleri]|uniref:FemAB family protein n=1 Tax=Aquimarina muelleri TaxID=279356 RepID=A0A918JS25_9FLAO|nr:peptidoglycan bridge formation glycyltransferase FemA/FemB family protein [Aquimarina muelleri]MCX2762063.1 aminoacyltransferase [Aquimarina muelleri]GGX04164.1 hypothetical protein GCM10007384_02450 [Aquimarina muelleri]